MLGEEKVWVMALIYLKKLKSRGFLKKVENHFV